VLEHKWCTRCGINPPVASVRMGGPGRRPSIEHLCAQCLAEVAPQTAGPDRQGLFDQFLRQFLAGSSHDSQRGDRREPVNHIDITQRFSASTRELLSRAAAAVADAGGRDLEPEHLLVAAIDDPTVTRVLAASGIDPDALGEWVRERSADSEAGGGLPATDADEVPRLSPTSKRVLLTAYEQSRRAGVTYIGPEHVMLALALTPATLASRALARFSVEGEGARRPPMGAVESQHQHEPPSETPTLDQYSRDLTGIARDGGLDPVIGRNDEIEQTIEVLSRRTKNNPVLVGDAGVGKTAIVEGIAQRIANGDVPDTLADRRLLSLELGGLLAGTRYRGEFEERMQSIMDEVRAHADRLLLFIDEIHMIVGAGGAEGALDAGNMLKPALARGELHVIGATTLDEYRRKIEADPALERRFQPVNVAEPSPEDAIQILYGLKDRYEAFHCVRYTDDAIDAAVELSDRYVADRFLPDKAIDLLDQAGARVRLRQGSRGVDVEARRLRIEELERDKDQAVAAEDYARAAELKDQLQELVAGDEGDDGLPGTGEVRAEDIADVVARRTGIPVAQLTVEERSRLLDLEAHLHRRVIDQTDAVSAVAQAIRRSRSGLGDPDRPVGSFLFLGPTGVGKTELARTLADALFGDEDLMIRFDMSEFQEQHTVSRLIGSPPGYVGYEEAGQLTERVRRRPYSVLLLDEIEKAHPDVYNVLLQLLDDGHVTDAQGRTVDFTNTIVIMTSNLGAERIHDVNRQIGFRPRREQDEAGDFQALRRDLMEELRRSFRPELLNRIDDIVVFRPLSREQLHEITGLLLDEIGRRLAGREIGMTVTDAAIDHLADVGFDPEFGARPLRRAIQRELENRISELLLEGSIDPGDAVDVDLEEGALTFRIDAGGFHADVIDVTEDRPDREPEPAGPSSPRA
jgi:ATP-dependent Clp protease ATP-binding subunit ClpC